MNVLVSSVAEDSMNGRVAGTGAEKCSIERFYPMAPSKQMES